MGRTSNTVLCACCNQYLSRHRERAHRLRGLQIATPPVVSALPRVTEVSSDEASDPGNDANISIDNPAQEPILPEEAYELEDPAGPVSDDNEAALLQAWYQQRQRQWEPLDDGSDSDEPEDDEDRDSEDSTDGEDYPDWAAYERGTGLSAWDQLGEGYERDAVGIGMSQNVSNDNTV